MDAFMKGFTFADFGPVDRPRPPSMGPLYNPSQSDPELKKLANSGVNWIILVSQVWQETLSSTNISRHEYNTPSDDSLRHVINMAHSLGIRVVLSPYMGMSIDVKHTGNPSPVNIGTAFYNELQWREWFTSYGETINYYASLAQDTGADMFCIGHELGYVTQREEDWRRVAKEVRARFKGPITYASLCVEPDRDPGAEMRRIKWWDAVDYIGVDVYFRLTDKNNPTVEELKAAWKQKGYLTLLEDLSAKFNKPIIFTEFGYRSIDGANKVPGMWTSDGNVDLQEQADCYQAAFEVLWDSPWLKGIFWYTWFANPVVWPGGLADKNYTPSGKPAEEVVKKYYLSK
jgi:hypothetical protein